MIPPYELEKRAEFKTAFRGYDTQQVDEFVDAAVKYYDQLYQSNITLENEIKNLNEKINSLNSQKLQINENAKKAKAYAEQVVAIGNDNANKSLEEAKDKLHQIIDSARAAYEECIERTELLNETVRKYKGEIFALYQKQIMDLHNFESGVTLPEFNFDFDLKFEKIDVKAELPDFSQIDYVEECSSSVEVFSSENNSDSEEQQPMVQAPEEETVYAADSEALELTGDDCSDEISKLLDDLSEIVEAEPEESCNSEDTYEEFNEIYFTSNDKND